SLRTPDNQHQAVLESIGIGTIQSHEPLPPREELLRLPNVQLKQLLRERNKAISGNKEDLVARLLQGDPIPVPLSASLIKKWFMRPVKSNTSMKLGLLNEVRLQASLHMALQREGYEVCHLEAEGLVRCKEAAVDVVACSPDLMGVVKRLSADADAAVPCVIEFKTMTTTDTEDKARIRIQNLSHRKKIIECNFGSGAFAELVWTKDYRAQVLHNAFVTGVDVCLFVVGRVGLVEDIIYIVYVNISCDILSSYKVLFTMLKPTILDAYAQAVNLETAELGNAVDMETIKFTQKLARAIMILNSQRIQNGEELLPPAHQITPELVALWNSIKGGQDVVSRILKNVKIDFAVLSPRAFTFIRSIQIMLLNAHLSLRIFSIVEKGQNQVADNR
ncbi:MAG: SAP domain-containing protein, partial [Gaiellaceae bacterium]